MIDIRSFYIPFFEYSRQKYNRQQEDLKMETNSKTKLCKYCKTEIPKGAKICATCGKKQGGKLKWVIIVIVVLLFLPMGSDDGKQENTNTQEASSNMEESNVTNTEVVAEDIEKDEEDDKSRNSETEEVETEDEKEMGITYTSHTVNQMMEDLNANAMKASSIYKDQYIEITGKLKNIDSSGAYISLYSDNEWDFIGVTCYLKNDEQREQVMNMSIGDTVTLKGKCTEVGEVLGYSLNIDSIN